MTDTTQNTEQTPADNASAATEAAAPASSAEQAKQEAVAKAQEMGKKLTGFFGGLAEKAKGLDVKELTEKAKQKVNEVKDKAAELNAGKSENQIPLRETMTAEQVKNLFDEAMKATDEFPQVIDAVLADVAQGEPVVCKVKLGTAADPAYIASSAKNVFQFVKNADQYMISIYPVSKIQGFSVLPPRGDAMGKFVIMLEKEDIKLNLSSMEAYARSIILYKKLKELIEK